MPSLSEAPEVCRADHDSQGTTGQDISPASFTVRQTGCHVAEGRPLQTMFTSQTVQIPGSVISRYFLCLTLEHSSSLTFISIPQSLSFWFLHRYQIPARIMNSQRWYLRVSLTGAYEMAWVISAAYTCAGSYIQISRTHIKISCDRTQPSS